MDRPEASPSVRDLEANAETQAQTEAAPAVVNESTPSGPRLTETKLARIRAKFARGATIAGKYVVEDVLGKGGMGLVVSARHVALSQRFAIKVLIVEGDGGEEETREFERRFVQEARVSASLRSPHVVRVVDVATMDDLVYMVMELASGMSLARVLREQTTLPVAVAVDYAVQLCEGLAEAHARGIIHRDIKPTNLYVETRADGSSLVKILDFGISKLLGQAERTRTGMLVGSPFYMAPEQLRQSSSVDARADIWSVGVVLYQCLAGKPPFAGSMTSVVQKLLSEEPPPPLSTFRDDVPPQLEAAILTMLQRDASARPANVADVARALLEASPLPESTTRVAQIEATLHRERRSSSPEDGDESATTSSSKNRRLLLGIGVGVGVAALLALFLRGRGADPAGGTVQPEPSTVTTTATAPTQGGAASPTPTAEDRERPASATTGAATVPAQAATTSGHDASLAPRRPLAPIVRPKVPASAAPPTTTTTTTTTASPEPSPKKPTNPFEERQ